MEERDNSPPLLLLHLMGLVPLSPPTGAIKHSGGGVLLLRASVPKKRPRKTRAPRIYRFVLLLGAHFSVCLRCERCGAPSGRRISVSVVSIHAGTRALALCVRVCVYEGWGGESLPGEDEMLAGRLEISQQVAAKSAF